MQSGIDTLPLVLSMVVASILAGALTQKIGYYVPVMILCPAIMATGLGLMSTFRVGETSAHWIGYQFLVGYGLGTGMQSSGLAAQAVLPKPDIPTGISIMFFCQQLGGGIFTSVGQNLLSSYMVRHVADIPGLNPAEVTSEGATDLVDNVLPAYRPRVKQLYNNAISRIFLCGMGVALVALVAALFMEWRNIKKTGPGFPPGGKPSGVVDANEGPSPSDGEIKSTTQAQTENDAQTHPTKEERGSEELRDQTPIASSSKSILEQSVAHLKD